MSRKDGISQGAMDGGAICEPKDGQRAESFTLLTVPTVQLRAPLLIACALYGERLL